MTTEFLSSQEIDTLLQRQPACLEGVYPFLNKGLQLFVEDENQRKVKVKITSVEPHPLAIAGINPELKFYKLQKI